MGLFMIYRVIKEGLNHCTNYDFDDIEDAEEWVRQEIQFDKNSDNPQVFRYRIIEVK